MEAYGDLPTIEDVAIAPNGSLAIAGKIDGVRRIVLLDAQLKPLAIRNIGEIKFDSVTWAGDQFAIARVRGTVDLSMDFTTDKAELAGAAIIPAGDGEVDGVFGKSPLIADLIMGFYGNRFIEGKWHGYFGGIKYRRESKMGYVFDHNRPSLFAVDLKDNRPRQIASAAAEGHWRDWLVHDNGQVAATLDLNTTGEWTIENDQNKVIASGVQKLGGIDFLSLGRDGTSVIYRIEDKDQETFRFMEVPLAGGTSNEILAEVGIDRFYIDRTNSRLLGYLPVKSTKTVLFDGGKQAILDKAYRAFSKLHTTIVEWTPSFSHLLIHTSGNADSGTWFLVDLAKLKADPIGYDRPQIGPEDVGPISLEEYTASDGLEMDGVLTLPPDREPKGLPVVIFPHGGPSAHDEVAFDWWAQAFASRGYAVFQPNFRGSTNRDVAFQRAGNGEWGRKMQSDISDGLAELVRKGIVDPNRACIMGASYGGYARWPESHCSRAFTAARWQWHR